MGFAKIMPVGNVHPCEWFEIGEFFRFDGTIWVKYSDRCAININGNDDVNQEFSSDAECENIDVELNVL